MNTDTKSPLVNPAWADKEDLLRKMRAARVNPVAQAADRGPIDDPVDTIDPMGAYMGAAAAAAPSTVQVQVRDEHESKAYEIIDIVANKSLSEQERSRLIDQIDPSRKLVAQMIASGDADIARINAERQKRDKLVRSYERAIELMRAGDKHLVLQQNECSRLHKFIEACQRGMFYDNDQQKFNAPQTPDLGDNAQVIVVRHDWARAFGENFSFDQSDAFKLPFPSTVFEFRISGITVLMMTKEKPDQSGIEFSLAMEGVDGIWWSAFDGDEGLNAFCERQVRAICVALEARVAEHTVTRAPAKLNAKRERDGKPPLRDFLVVDLSRRIRARSRAEQRPDAQPTGRRVRLHFRRGHWRHYESHNTWIEWMLVGDPDLGFIDKHYRI